MINHPDNTNDSPHTKRDSLFSSHKKPAPKLAQYPGRANNELKGKAYDSQMNGIQQA